MPAYTVLIAGADPVNTGLRERTLAGAGYKTSRCEPGTPVRVALEEFSYDLVLLDADADADADADGDWSALREASPTSRFLVLTSSLTTELALQGLRHGVSDLLVEPVAPATLLRTVERILADAQRRVGPAVEATLRATRDGTAFPLDKPLITIGRRRLNDVRLDVASVSKFHAEIVQDRGVTFVRDKHSLHGTWVNGERVTERPLKPGDRIRLGAEGPELAYETSDDASFDSNASWPGAARAGGGRGISLMLEAMGALSRAFSLQDVLSLVIDSAVRMASAERGFVLLTDADGALTIALGRDARRETIAATFDEISRTIPAKAMSRGEPVMVPDLEVASGSHPSTINLGLRSVLCAPLMIQLPATLDGTPPPARTIGALYLDSHASMERFGTKAQAALGALASQAAVAIEQARLHAREIDRQKMDRELSIAREIQLSLLPPPTDLPAGWRLAAKIVPSREVGGDFYDFTWLSDGRLAIVLADAAGKGIPAALFAAMAQGTMAAHIRLMEVGAAVAATNEILARSPAGGELVVRFLTLFCVVLDPQGLLCYTNAGHNPPLLVRGDGAVEELTEGGRVIGLFEAASYDEGRARMRPGDVLALYSDGITEARSADDEEFGVARLRQLLIDERRLEPQAILDRVHAAVEEFARGVPQFDDMTLLVLKLESH